MSLIPLAYTAESLRVRWTSALVAVLGIAGAVAVFVAMLALAKGFEAALVTSGQPGNAVLRRAGATAEIDSSVEVDQLHVVEDSPYVARKGSEPLVSPELVVIGDLPLADGGGDANVQVRGVSRVALDVHTNVRIKAGRFFAPGLPELVVGSNAVHSYAGVGLGQVVSMGGVRWTVVGILEAGGSSFDSEIWCDSNVLGDAFQKPKGVFQSVTVRLQDPRALDDFRAALARDPRLKVQVDGEVEYYRKASRTVTGLITALGRLVGIVMGIGAVLGALNTMYSAVAERSREIATLRAIGFGVTAILVCFLVESLGISFVGGVLGCLLALPVNGLTTGTVNWQTFSHLAFAFQITPPLLVLGVAFALLMGVAGGVPPAFRAARLPVAEALRDL
jgi:putative ABC transport system permease protein